ncbi:hypothetical protein [Dongia deserti]|uniref:hypothetical protein n=1 Tax=Dongia deserti TaxID=2268030 RepID=UPI000E65DF5C|nr:hypothetical protein [Dongia deserti]
MLEEIFAKADPATQAAIGRYLAELGAKLLAAADRDDELTRELERRRAGNERYRKLAALVTRLVLFGKEPDEAAGLIARRFHMDCVRLAAWWRSVEGRRAVRRLRDKRILRHAAAGRHDAEIAALFGMHRKSANRVVRRMVRARRAAGEQVCHA